jgi:hypothetical protein
MPDPDLSRNSFENIAGNLFETWCLSHVTRRNSMQLGRAYIPAWIDKGRVFVTDLPSLIKGNYSNLHYTVATWIDSCRFHINHGK